jgi:hypothetical protein
MRYFIAPSLNGKGAEVFALSELGDCFLSTSKSMMSKKFLSGLNYTDFTLYNVLSKNHNVLFEVTEMELEEYVSEISLNWWEMLLEDSSFKLELVQI